jgi:hypothetical protein
MSTSVIRVAPDWLALREPADAAARSRELVDHLAPGAAQTERWLIHDLGGGTGSMGRWLAPLLHGAQHWVVHDRDADLLNLVTTHPPGRAADDAVVTVETRQSDVTRLDPGDLAGATLVTASALLDMLTEDELRRLIGACAGARCPILLALSVVGRVGLTPPDPLDARISAAFNAHQRRRTARGSLLGPDAVAWAAEELARLGLEVLVRASPWRLDGSSHPELTRAWFTGWVGAACEQDAELTAQAGAYTRRRLAEARAGRLEAVVEHADLLALPS